MPVPEQIPEHIRCGVPEWLYDLVVAQNGKEQAELFFAAVNRADSKVSARMNLREKSRDEIFRMLIEKGKGIEINTAGLRRNMKDTNPNETFLKRYRELGGEIITAASDAHEPAIIASAFDQAEAILKRCGFTHYTVFQERKPVFLPL